MGKSDAAIESYELLMQRSPGNHVFPVSLAHIHKANGDIDAAVALYRKAYRLKRDHGDAYWSLANTKSYRFTDEELARMTAVESDEATGAIDRVHLCFALGKAYEDRGEFPRSFEFYARGNALNPAGSKHSPEHLQVRVDSQIKVCTADFLASKQGLGYEAPDPIFIVGLPRSGSTLIEQILSSHSRGRWHHGTPQHPQPGQAPARARRRPAGFAPGTPASWPRSTTAISAASASSSSRTPAPIAARRPSSSTRCRTTSSTSG